MPSLIPQYQQRTRAGGGASIGVPENPEAIASGLRALGQGIKSFGESMARVREEDENAWAAENLATFQGKWQREGSARQESALPGASGITESFLADYDKDVEELVNRAPSERVRRYLKQRAGIEYREHLFTGMSVFEARSAAEHSNAIISAARGEKRKVVQSDPFMYGQMVAEMDEMVGGMRSPEARKAEHRELSRQELANDAVIGLIHIDPSTAAKLLRAAPGKSGLDFVEALSADDRLARANQAEAEVDRREADFRARRNEARIGLAEAQADALAAKGSGLPAELPSRSAYLAAYGEDGDERYRNAQQLMATYDTVSAAVLLPPGEGLARLARFAPTEQEGAADQARVLGEAQQLYGEQRKQFEANPAASVVMRDPGLQEALMAIDDGTATPTQITGYTRQVRAAQQAAGILEPKLLPADYAARLAASLAFDPEKPGLRAERLAGLRAQWGPAFPQVVREISPTLEGDARVMVSMRPEIAKKYDQAIATADKVKARVLEADARDIKENIRANLGGLEETLLHADDGIARFAEIQHAAQLLAMTYVGDGTEAAEAARLATEAVVNERYDYRDTLRVPVDVDADLMEQSTIGIKFNLPELQITPVAGDTSENAQAELKAYIEREGYWVTTSDEAGAELRVPYQGRSVPVLRADGTRVRFTWDELAVSKARWAPEYVRKGLPK